MYNIHNIFKCFTVITKHEGIIGLVPNFQYYIVNDNSLELIKRSSTDFNDFSIMTVTKNVFAASCCAIIGVDIEEIVFDDEYILINDTFIITAKKLSSLKKAKYYQIMYHLSLLKYHSILYNKIPARSNIEIADDPVRLSDIFTFKDFVKIIPNLKYDNSDFDIIKGIFETMDRFEIDDLPISYRASYILNTSKYLLPDEYWFTKDDIRFTCLQRIRPGQRFKSYWHIFSTRDKFDDFKKEILDNKEKILSEIDIVLKYLMGRKWYECVVEKFEVMDNWILNIDHMVIEVESEDNEI